MRIFYTHDIFSRQTIGGISRYYVELIRNLAGQSAVEVKVLAGRHSNQHLRELDGASSLVGRYGEKPRFARSCQRLMNYYVQERSGLSPARGVVHHTYYSFRRPLGKARLVATIHDMIPECFPKQFGWKARMLSAAKRRTCELAERVITNSHTTKQDLVERYGISPDRVDVTYLGNSIARYAPLNEPSPCDSPYLLYVGARGGYKNCRVLWEAYSKSPRVREAFQIVCFGGGLLTSAERQLLEELKIAGQVLQCGGTDRELANHYRHASAFVYPSIHEGFGIPPVEAMTFGCPIIASTAGAIPEVVGGAAEYIDPYDTDMLCAALEKVLFDESVRQQLRNAMKQRVTLFDWRETARQTLACYEKAAA